MAHTRKFYRGPHDGRVEEGEADDQFVALNRHIYERSANLTTPRTSGADTTAIYYYLKSVASSEVLDTLRTLEKEAERWEEE